MELKCGFYIPKDKYYCRAARLFVAGKLPDGRWSAQAMVGNDLELWAIGEGMLAEKYVHLEGCPHDATGWDWQPPAPQPKRLGEQLLDCLRKENVHWQLAGLGGDTNKKLNRVAAEFAATLQPQLVERVRELEKAIAVICHSRTSVELQPPAPQPKMGEQLASLLLKHDATSVLDTAVAREKYMVVAAEFAAICQNPLVERVRELELLLHWFHGRACAELADWNDGSAPRQEFESKIEKATQLPAKESNQ
jgi:hypothetical protein